MYKRGNRWYSDFWYKGERYIKSHGPISKTTAKEKDRDFRSDVASGRYTKLKNNPLFEDALKEFLKRSKENNQPNTYTANYTGLSISSHFLKAIEFSQSRAINY